MIHRFVERLLPFVFVFCFPDVQPLFPMQMSKGKAVTENISLADSMNLTQPSDGSSDAAQMKIISSANGIIASSILGNEKGCYEVF